MKQGSNIADEIDSLCQDVGYWQRCDYFGTYKATVLSYNNIPVAYFKDTETVISVNQTIDYTNTVNHIMISGVSDTEHFFDNDLWIACKGERRTCQFNALYADTYGKKKRIAEKMFSDMKMFANTLQVIIEGNPYLELLDTINIEHAKTTVKDNYIIKGIRDSYSVNAGYITTLDLFWAGE